MLCIPQRWFELQQGLAALLYLNLFFMPSQTVPPYDPKLLAWLYHLLVLHFIDDFTSSI